MNFLGKHVLVMGLGIHGGGLGVARFLVQQGAVVTVTDLRNAEQLQGSLDALADLPIRFVLGKHAEADFEQAEIVIRNPAVPPNSRFLQIARAAGAQIEMEMSLFFRLCPGPILGVTGTKGKTTTTMLLGAMLRVQFPDTVVAGNLRVSALEQLPLITPHTPVVLELSSFALEGLGEAGLSPQYALFTNLSPDHLDRYGTMQAYAEAKMQIWRSQQPGAVVALNADDAWIRPMAAALPPGVALHWFGRDVPGAPAMQVCDGEIRQLLANETQTLCHNADIRLIGEHNRVNVAAAATLAAAFGVTQANMLAAIRAFTGVPYRLEPVRELDGVLYINDTAATAPDAAIAALQSITRPIILISGGADKNLPFGVLARTMLSRTKAIVLLEGSATPKLLAELGTAASANTPPIAGPYNEFSAALHAARALAASGDVILLSPGCASFGMFRNEFHRGDEFRRIVSELA